MADKQKNNVNEDQILSFLQETVDKIRTEEDPLELNVYRRLFRKAVPLTLRSYFAAYLLKQLFSGKMTGKFNVSSRNDRSGKQTRRDRNEGRPGRQDLRSPETRPEELRRGKQGEGRRGDGRQGESRQNEGRQNESRNEGRQNDGVKAESRPVLPDDIATTLFISIGRNRRVYPRDLIGLIMQKVEIDREHIGDIRVLDNYSFVQVITEDAARVIEALNEFEYRGRKLAVSYSRKREESAEESSLSATSLPEPEDAGSWQTESDLPDGEENNGNI